MNFLKSLPFQLCLSITASFMLGQLLSSYAVSLFYTVSSLFIEFILFTLPVIIFVFIVRALLNISQKSFSLLILIFLGVTVSNCLALLVSYFFSISTLPFLGLGHLPDFAEKFKSSIEPLVNLELPTLISSDKALAFGIAMGVGFSFLKEENTIKQHTKNLFIKLGDKIGVFLNKVFIPLLPLYVFGFCLKLSYDNALVHLFQQYGKVFLLSVCLVIFYLSLLYYLGNKGNVSNAIKSVKCMFPAGLTGFSTMSSIATMPVTLTCTEKNTSDKSFTDLVIPSTANIHMLGDDLTIVVTALTLLSVFGLPWPDLSSFIVFACAFSVAKLSCVGVPGASVLVVLPILQQYMGFTPEMISILTTIYVLQDPFGTFANVMGNGAFAMIIQRVFRSFGRIRKLP